MHGYATRIALLMFCEPLSRFNVLDDHGIRSLGHHQEIAEASQSSLGLVFVSNPSNDDILVHKDDHENFQ